MFSFFPESFDSIPGAAIFMSGTGSNAENLLTLWKQGKITNWKPCVMVTDRPAKCNAPRIANQFNIPLVSLDLTEFYHARGFESTSLKTPGSLEIRDAWVQCLRDLLEPYHADFGIFCGFTPLSNITEYLPCLNVHPGDLTAEQDGRRIYAGLHRIPVEAAILNREPCLRSSVILAQPFHGFGGDIDAGPILGISAPVPIELAGHTYDELDAVRAARVGSTPKERETDPLGQLALANIDTLKLYGDFVVLPQVARDYADCKFALRDDGVLLYCGNPVRTVEYSASAAPVPVPLP